MDDETRAAIQHLSERVEQSEKNVASLLVGLCKQGSLLNTLMDGIATSVGNEVSLLDRTKALENNFKVLEHTFADINSKLTPQGHGEVTIAEAVQKLIYTVGKITDEMLLYRRNMREAPPRTTTSIDESDEDPLISPILN
jgi:hypothetical protein